MKKECIHARHSYISNSDMPVPRFAFQKINPNPKWIL